jgi:hypothetical protein
VLQSVINSRHSSVQGHYNRKVREALKKEVTVSRLEIGLHIESKMQNKVDDSPTDDVLNRLSAHCQLFFQSNLRTGLSANVAQMWFNICALVVSFLFLS